MKVFKRYKTNIKRLVILLLVSLMFLTSLTGCSDESISDSNLNQNNNVSHVEDKEDIQDTSKEEKNEDKSDKTDNKTDKNHTNTSTNNSTTTQKNDLFKGYTLIEVDGGDLSGTRKAKVVVDIGFGDREYWAFTNEYGQLVKVVADKIVLQDDSKEPVTSDGRYYRDEAKVPGTERSDLDEGHVIADSLGGVSNAYNITPQDSTLNRHGDQAYMEKVIRDAGGCTNFVAIITYPDTKTQIPSHYSFTYTLKGNVIHDEFDNVNPEKSNTTDKNTSDKNTTSTNSTTSSDKNTSSNTNNNQTTTTNKTETNTTTNKDTSTSCYITKTGKKYHSIPNCGTTKSATKTTVSAAKEKGLGPCSKCW